MASTTQEYFILRNDLPIARTNNFFKNLLNTLNADHVLKGELLVKEALPQDGSHQSHAMYSLALDRNKMVSCSNSDVAPLSEDDYEWLAAIGKTVDRWQVYIQGDKLETVKKLQVGEIVRVTITAGDGTPPPFGGYLLLPRNCAVHWTSPRHTRTMDWSGTEGKIEGTLRV